MLLRREYPLLYYLFQPPFLMNYIDDKPYIIKKLPPPNLSNISCPNCNSSNIIRINSYLRTIKDLGTKNTRKFVEFESIHLKCKSCLLIFQLKQAEIVKGLSITRDVLDTILLLYYKFENSAKKIVELMESLYSVKLDRSSVLKWVRKFGIEYCEKNNIGFHENFKATSGHFGADGTFPKLRFLSDKDLKDRYKEKKMVVPWLYLTELPDGNFCAIWEEVKINKK